MSGPIDGVTSIVSDLAPLSSLIGEKTVKAYLAHVTNPLEYGLLSLAPLGVVTVLVSVLRLSDFYIGRLAIGRASETKVEFVRELLKGVTEGQIQAFDGSGEISLLTDEEAKPLMITKIKHNSKLDLEKMGLVSLPTAYKEEHIIFGRTECAVSWATARPWPLYHLIIGNFFIIICNAVITWWRIYVGDTLYGIIGYWMQMLGMFACMWVIDKTTTEVTCESTVPVCGRYTKMAFKGDKGRHVISHFQQKIPTLHTILASALLTCGFVLNYLGLRQLPWQIALTIVILAWISTLLRAYIMGYKSKPLEADAEEKLSQEISELALEFLDESLVDISDNILTIKHPYLEKFYSDICLDTSDLIIRKAYDMWLGINTGKIVVIIGDPYHPNKMIEIRGLQLIGTKVIQIRNIVSWIANHASPLTPTQKEELTHQINNSREWWKKRQHSQVASSISNASI